MVQLFKEDLLHMMNILILCFKVSQSVEIEVTQIKYKTKI